jgi:hypothetical protein
VWSLGGVGRIDMNRGRVGEERRGKEMDRCPLTVSALSAVLWTCSWKLSFELNVIPSHLMCGDGSIVVVFVSWVLGMLIDGFLLLLHLHLVK